VAKGPDRSDQARRAQRAVREDARPGAGRRGFSLLELLVVLGVTWLLIALLMPAFARLRESARRVGCASNMHQIAIALESFARENRNRFPHSYYAGDQRREARPQDMMILNRGTWGDTWDGVGRLYSQNYLSDPGAFYCPSHTGEHPIERYQNFWNRRSRAVLFGNYHYRGLLNLASLPPDPIDRHDRDKINAEHPAGISILADGLRTKSDFSHLTGSNLLMNDLSVAWMVDERQRLYNMLPNRATENWPRSQIWAQLDRGAQHNK